MLRTAAAVLALAALPASAFAETRKVPSEQYPTIQSAVSTVQSGDVILVSKGTYVENVTISGNPSFTLKGKGNPVIDGSGGICISVSFDQNITISGFVLSNADEGVRVTGSNHISLSRLSISGTGSSGIHLRNGCSTVTIAKCGVNGTGGEGILDEESADLVVTKCAFSGTGLAAIALSPNYVTGSGLGSPNAMVTKNRIDGSGATGIHWGGNGVLVSKNRITGTGSIGILNDASTTTMGSTVEKNRVTDAGDEGICIGGSSNTVSKNTVTNAMGNGIQVEGANDTIQKNRIVAPNLSGIFVSGSGGHILDGNSIVAADVYGIVVQTAGNTLGRNRASGSGMFDLYDDFPEGTSTYDGNRFGTTFYGP